MATKSNKKLGNDFENRFCLRLFDAGFWVHRLNQNAAGQPADLIAVRNKRGFLIDCKVCTGNGFRLNRVEENQDLSMGLWKERGNGNGWFAIELSNGDIYMLMHDDIKDYREEVKVLKEETIREECIGLKEWLNIYAR